MTKTSSLRVKALRAIHAITVAANGSLGEEDFVALVSRCVATGFSSPGRWNVAIRAADRWFAAPEVLDMPGRISEPIIVEGGVFGAIWVWRSQDVADVGPAPLGPGGQCFLQEVAGILGHFFERRAQDSYLALQRSNRALRTIIECTAAIVRANDESTLLQDICRTAVEAGGYARVWVGQPEDGVDDEPVLKAIREQRTIVTRGTRIDADWRPRIDEGVGRAGPQASVSLPLVLEGQCNIALVVHSVEPDAFDEEEVALLAGLAKDLSFGLVALRGRADRNHAQTVLRQTMDDYKSLLDSSPVVVYRLLVVGGEVVTKMVSTNIAWTLGYDVGEAFSVTWWTSHLHPDDRDAARTRFGRIFTEGTVTHEYRFAHKDGRYVWIRDEVRLIRDEQGNPAEIVGAWSDVTETKRMSDALLQTNADLVREHDALRKTLDELARAQSQLLQSEKMAAVGQLAAGVAHEINNPVGFVSSNLNTLKTYTGQLLAAVNADHQAMAQLAPDHPARLGVEKAHQAADVAFLQQDIPDLLRESAEGLDRVRKIVADLKNFSHVDEQEWQEADLNKGLESTLNVAWNELKYKAMVVREFGELPLVRCIPAQINQVFLNLLINAGQAIETKGTITLRTGHDDAFAWVEIADTGKGIPHDIQERIFEPFFTTKPVGKGTGLGLSISWDIVQRHKGSIRVASEPGQGSVFRIQLPLK